MHGHVPCCTEDDVRAVFARDAMLLPAVEPRSGPFPDRTHHWTVAETEAGGGQRYAAASFYLALMTGVCLDITGAGGPVIVEGPFARNALYRAMLAAVVARPVLPGDASTAGTSIGAALLAREHGTPIAKAATAPTAPPPLEMAAFALAWRERVLGSQMASYGTLSPRRRPLARCRHRPPDAPR